MLLQLLLLLLLQLPLVGGLAADLLEGLAAAAHAHLLYLLRGLDRCKARLLFALGVGLLLARGGTSRPVAGCLMILSVLTPIVSNGLLIDLGGANVPGASLQFSGPSAVVAARLLFGIRGQSHRMSLQPRQRCVCGRGRHQLGRSNSTIGSGRPDDHLTGRASSPAGTAATVLAAAAGAVLADYVVNIGDVAAQLHVKILRSVAGGLADGAQGAGVTQGVEGGSQLGLLKPAGELGVRQLLLLVPTNKRC